MGQRYRRMEDQKPEPGLACSQDFADRGGLEPKSKKFFKDALIGRSGEENSITQTFP